MLLDLPPRREMLHMEYMLLAMTVYFGSEGHVATVETLKRIIYSRIFCRKWKFLNSEMMEPEMEPVRASWCSVVAYWHWILLDLHSWWLIREVQMYSSRLTWLTSRATFCLWALHTYRVHCHIQGAVRSIWKWHQIKQQMLIKKHMSNRTEN